MSRSSWSRILMTSLLFILLAAPCAWAKESDSPRLAAVRFFSLADLFDRAWTGLVSLWANNGASADPDGGNSLPQSQACPETAVDNGAIIDPNGGCQAGS